MIYFMRVLIFSIFVTFVGLRPLWAAPQTTLKEQPQNYEAQKDPYLAARKGTDSQLPQLGTFFVAGGLYSGRIIENEITTESAAWHLRYTALDSNWSFHLEQLEAGVWGVGASQQHRLIWETALRLSFNIISDKSGEVGGPFEIKRWRARAGWVIGESWTIEPGVGIAITGFDTYLLVGYQFKF